MVKNSWNEHIAPLFSYTPPPFTFVHLRLLQQKEAWAQDLLLSHDLKGYL